MPETTANSRLEAFCDGVFAIALTLLVIDIKLPATLEVSSTEEFWRALVHMGPSICAFLLSFVVIFITWVNHHGALVLVRKATTPFIYANGCLLLTVVLVPFPTALVGEHLLTEHAGPAVALYDGVLALQSLGWLLVGQTALAGRLPRHAAAEADIRENRRYAIGAFVLYSACAVAALWLPLTMALTTAVTWIFWLVVGIRLEHE